MTDTSQDLVEIEFDRVIARTDDAIMFNFDGQQEWIPRTLIAAVNPEDVMDESQPYLGTGTILIPEWLVIDRGLDALV